MDPMDGGETQEPRSQEEANLPNSPPWPDNSIDDNEAIESLGLYSFNMDSTKESSPLHVFKKLTTINHL